MSQIEGRAIGAETNQENRNKGRKRIWKPRSQELLRPKQKLWVITKKPIIPIKLNAIFLSS